MIKIEEIKSQEKKFLAFYLWYFKFSILVHIIIRLLNMKFILKIYDTFDFFFKYTECFLFSSIFINLLKFKKI